MQCSGPGWVWFFFSKKDDLHQFFFQSDSERCVCFFTFVVNQIMQKIVDCLVINVMIFDLEHI